MPRPARRHRGSEPDTERRPSVTQPVGAIPRGTYVDVLSTSVPGIEALTISERISLAYVIKGASSKETAQELGISHRAVELHRASILRKFGARNLTDLVAKILTRS